MRDGRLTGLSILIVGGTSGLGLSAARACRREGARLTIVGRDDEHVEAAAGELGLASDIVVGDAAEPGTCERAVVQAVARFGRLDGVFHVAGGSGRRAGDGPLHQISDEGWRYTLDANLTSLFNTNRAAVRHFLKAGRGGTVLNTSSVLGFSPAPAHFATHAYAAAKAAVIGLTTSCASYYARDNIRFNTIAPSLVNTPGSQRAVRDASTAEFIRRRQPLDGGRIGRPDDVDGGVVYFLSPESRFVTGQVLSVDGGWSVSDASGEGVDESCSRQDRGRRH